MVLEVSVSERKPVSRIKVDMRKSYAFVCAQARTPRGTYFTTAAIGVATRDLDRAQLKAKVRESIIELLA